MSKPPHLYPRYARSMQGILKIFELLMLVTSVACILQYNKINTVPIPGRELFFLCVCLSGLFFVIFIYWIKLFQLDRICCSKASIYNVWEISIEFVMAVLCAVASGLLVILVHNHESGVNMWHFAHLLVAVVFCFIASLLFLVDSAVGIRQLMRKIKRASLTRGYDYEGSFVVRNNNN